jgi:hypothetical protein
MTALSTAGQPVFVADRPRRATYTRWAGRAVAALAGAYVLITIASLVGAPWVPHVRLPGVGAVTLNQVPEKAAPLEGRTTPLSTPDVSLQRVAPVVSEGPSATAAATPAVQPAPTPGRSGDAPGQSGSAPGQSGSAPGQSGSAPGNSESAPGHTGAAPGRSKASPGNSATAPGHSSSGASHSSSSKSHKP